jgi:hypothetical protein
MQGGLQPITVGYSNHVLIEDVAVRDDARQAYLPRSIASYR